MSGFLAGSASVNISLQYATSIRTKAPILPALTSLLLETCSLRVWWESQIKATTCPLATFLFLRVLVVALEDAYQLWANSRSSRSQCVVWTTN